MAGVAVWFVLLRTARWLSPAARADRLLARGEYGQVLALAESELAVKGDTAWRGNRRLAWLNRRTTALLSLGRLNEALLAALEALDGRPDPVTLANLAQCLLWLNRYVEAAGAARQALALTRDRSVSAHAVLAHVLLAEGRPAEAQATARAGLADVEALMPFFQPAHQIALLAALCRALRILGDTTQAQRRLASLRRAARRSPLFQAQALLEEADTLASGDAAEQEQAFALLQRAIERAPHYVCWYAAQPLTLHELRDEPRFARLMIEARNAWMRSVDPRRVAPHLGAPPAAYVAMELATARLRGFVRPAPHASWNALVVQGLTLSGTLALLAWWTWRFFLLGT